MVAFQVFLAFTLSVHISNAQDQQIFWQMPQYEDGGLSFSPVMEEFVQQELFNFHQVRSDPVSSPSRQRCVLDQYERIECGETDITPDECDAISCCYDGKGCYYAKAVTLQCTSDGQFVLVVARDATTPRISLDSIHMLKNDPSGQCASVDTTDNFAMYQFPVSSCGTKMKEEDDYVVYENMMSSAYEVGNGSISSDSSYELKFQCRYSGTAVEALMMEVNTVAPPPPVSQQTPLSTELKIANGQCTTKECSNARTVSDELKDPVGEFLVSSGKILPVSNMPVLENLKDEEVSNLLGYGLWAGASLTVFGVCGLLSAVLIQRTRPRPQPVPV